MAERRQTVVLDQNLAVLEDEIRFDHQLKEKYHMREDETAIKARTFQKKVLSKIKNVALVIFYILIPFVQTPNWCTKGFATYSREIGDE